jgi:hypothetical protein
MVEEKNNNMRRRRGQSFGPIWPTMNRDLAEYSEDIKKIMEPSENNSAKL